jgi:hypothetical protein
VTDCVLFVVSVAERVVYIAGITARPNVARCSSLLEHTVGEEKGHGEAALQGRRPGERRR